MRRSSSKAEEKTRKPAARPKPSRAPKPGRTSKKQPGTRKEAILDAALSVFAEEGYQAARVDDVARRAGVAKGTLYLYFDDKETLFEEVVRGAISPVLERISLLAAAPYLSIEQVLDALFSVFEKEILETRRKLIVRLIIAEGPRFPRIAEFYYRNVVGRVMPLIANLAKRAAERGELPSDAVARYPQLVAAPLLVAVIWDALFARIEPLDVAAFFRAHREVLTGKKRRTAP
ncbi:TetR/AcrR family transcriptional regulator [Hyphomicrobium sp. CS1GBMeth3]|uniref:TetR/AcrR family transcriptional regulator n=1 Tax=Hyphomicrobium sp. CS1GBMeth3 TaxID=1892845 RepID=UPI00092FFA12|nr:TetR/AcrR family transcriptional regulator [Hyphomicrobium sp. CS1GBMeth3]